MKSTIIYDKFCLYCQKFINLVKKLDKQKQFTFLNIHNKKAKDILKKQFGKNYGYSIYLIDKDYIYSGGEATKTIFKILKTPILKFKYLHHFYKPGAKLISILTNRKEKIKIERTKKLKK